MGSLSAVCLSELKTSYNKHVLYSYCLSYNLVSRLCLFKTFSVDGCGVQNS